MANETMTNVLSQLGAKVSGPEGARRLLAQTDKTIEGLTKEVEALKHRLATTTGQLQGTQAFREALAGWMKVVGLDAVVTLPQVDPATPQGTPTSAAPIVEEPTADPETQARMDARKLCMWKGTDKKWCARQLKGKKAKESGFCSVHYDIAMGLRKE